MNKIYQIIEEEINRIGRINALLNSIEFPSHDENSKNAIQDFVNQVAEYFPEGISVNETLDNIPNEVPYSIKLKALIELAKNQLLTLGATDYKLKPEEILKIYGNPADVARNAKFELNELDINVTHQDQNGKADFGVVKNGKK